MIKIHLTTTINMFIKLRKNMSNEPIFYFLKLPHADAIVVLVSTFKVFPYSLENNKYN